MSKDNTRRLLITIFICSLALIGVLAMNEWFAYQHCKLYQSYEREISYLTKYPEGKYSSEVRNLFARYEKKYINENLYGLEMPSGVTNRMIEGYLSSYERYSSFFPEGDLRNQVDQFIQDLIEEQDFQKLMSSMGLEKEDFRAYYEKYPNTSHVKELEYKQATVPYENYSLANGSQPYSSYYGYNSTSGGCSIVIKSSSNHDCVVTVKYNNSDGDVAGHVYVRRGQSAEILLPSGKTYQVFFYSGTGWYPEKEMSKDVKGGFINDESFSYDDTPFSLSYGEYVTYTLTPVSNGNFTPRAANQNDYF